MRICLLTSSYPRFEGDVAGTFIRELCGELAGRGFSFTIVVPSPPARRRMPDEPGIAVAPFTYCLPRRAQTLAYGAGMEENLRRNPLRLLLIPPFGAALLAAALRSARRCDLIWSHWLLPAGLAGAAAGRLLGKPHLLTAHSVPPPPAFRLLRAVIGAETRLAAVSRGLAEEAARFLELPTGAIAVAPMGVRPECFLPRGERARLRARYGIGDEFVVLFMGRFAEIKGLDILVRALAGLRGTLLVAAGEGPCRREIERLAKGLCVPVRFEGYVTGAHKLDLLSLCDIVAAPSLILGGGRSEGMPVGVLEALASGAPVVASASGGLAEAVTDGVNGILVPPGDVGALAGAIAALRRDRGRRDRLSEGARRSAAAYALPVAADRYEELFRACATRVNGRMP